MAYAQTSSGPQNEVLKLQDEITHEVNTDAQHLATSVFGKVGGQPDMQRVTDEQLDSRYRQAYTNNDREWLTQESQRDPDQFIKVARRIGVMKPEEIGQGLPPPPPPPPPPPVAAPAPLPPPGVTPAPVIPPPPGMNLGAVAQPAQPVPLTAPLVTQG